MRRLRGGGEGCIDGVAILEADAERRDRDLLRGRAPHAHRSRALVVGDHDADGSGVLGVDGLEPIEAVSAIDEGDGAGACVGTPRMFAKVGHFNIGTGAAATTVSITGVGFEPKAVLFWWSGRTDLAGQNGGGSYRRGIGFSTGPGARRVVSARVRDNVDPSSGSRRFSETEVIVSHWTGGGVDGIADLASLDADGFTLTIVNDFGTNIVLMAVLGPSRLGYSLFHGLQDFVAVDRLLARDRIRDL